MKGKIKKCGKRILAYVLVGAFVAGIAFLGEAASAMRIVAALLIVSGLVLMKISAPA